MKTTRGADSSDYLYAQFLLSPAVLGALLCVPHMSFGIFSRSTSNLLCRGPCSLLEGVINAGLADPAVTYPCRA